MRKVILGLVCCVMIFASATGAYAGKCSTKYPVILVHGALFSSNNYLGINYWWRIPKSLTNEGTEVYQTHQRPVGSSENMAKDISKELGELFALHPEWTKVNIIAHSQGPLAARYFISNLSIPGKGPAKNYVASLTSISGTHRGSKIADLLLGLDNALPSLGIVIEDLVNWYGKLFYYNTQDANSHDALVGLTSDYMLNIFNPNTPDADGVYYQSWGGKITSFNPLDSMSYTWQIIKLMGGGDNDGMVTLDCAKWGKWRGAMTSAWWSYGVSHLEEVDQLFGVTPGFDAPAFYVNAVAELKNMGF